jgi:outer membrane protein
VVFLLFDSANTFGDLRDPRRRLKLPLDGRAEYRIDAVSPGEYALLVYYDENDNDRLDKNFIGIPREPLGFSNRYRPKGPPSYTRAAFTLSEDESRYFDVRLYRALGKRGRLGIGAGVIARSSPYRDYDAGVYRFIPALTYNGERLQIFGPAVRFGLAGSGQLRLAATGRYRIGVYEESESRFLEGMGDRDDTLMAGLAVQAELPAGFDLTARYEHDVLDRIGGGEAGLELDKTFQAGIFRFTPEVALNWYSADVANHDFGVPAGKARPGRSPYRLDATFSAEIGLGVFAEISRDWLAGMSVAAEFLPGEVTDSPIVSEDYVVSGFAVISYVF